MENVLYISNVSGKYLSTSFCGTAIDAVKECGFEFHSVSNRDESTPEQMRMDEEKYGIHLYHADIERFPLSLGNIKAYRQVVKLIKEQKIDYIHCNTPVGGLLGRLAGRRCNVKRIIYQCHGFHFYKNAPLKNWIIFYPIEKWLAHKTDAIITINREDYEIASRKMHLRKHGKVYYVPGVGIDVDKFSNTGTDREALRKSIGLSDDDFAVVAVGRLEKNKNLSTLIKAVALTNNKNLKLIVCGEGELKKSLQELAETEGVKDNIKFLGTRNDMIDIYHAVDCFALTSFREGLSRSVMEAMASGLPCVVSKIRGNVDLIRDNVTGFTCCPADEEAFSEAIKALYENENLRCDMSKNCVNSIKKFDCSVVKDSLVQIYKKEFV